MIPLANSIDVHTGILCYLLVLSFGEIRPTPKLTIDAKIRLKLCYIFQVFFEVLFSFLSRELSKPGIPRP